MDKGCVDIYIYACIYMFILSGVHLFVSYNSYSKLQFLPWIASNWFFCGIKQCNWLCSETWNVFCLLFSRILCCKESHPFYVIVVSVPPYCLMSIGLLVPSNRICYFVLPAAWETADIDSDLRLYSFLSAFVVTPHLSHASWTEPNDRSISEKAFSDILQLPKFRELVSRRISSACKLCFQHHPSCRLFYITSFLILSSFIS